MSQTLLIRSEGGSAAETVSLKQLTSLDRLPFEVREHLARLRLLQPIITAAVSALRCQNADSDADIAYDLTEQVSEPLNYEIEYIEALLASRPRRRRQQEVHA